MQFNKVGTISDDLKPNDMVVGSWTSKDQIPQKYWDKEENPEYDPEVPDSPEFIYTNTFEEAKEDTPSSSESWEFQADGTWSDLENRKDNALEEVLLGIDQKNRDENAKDFTYANGDGATPYPYVADVDSIQAVAVETYSCPVDDPIPVPNGVWKTNAVEENGVTPVYVPYTCSEFQVFKSSFFMRSSNNFGVKEFHKNQLKTIYLNEETTEEDIYNYDYSTGWY